jgi:hypothetical protein
MRRRSRKVERARIKEKNGGKNVNEGRVEEGRDKKSEGMKRGRVRYQKCYCCYLYL